MKKEKILRNRCKCRKCGDVIESKHRHDFVWCKCRSVFTDGGTSYIRRGGDDFNVIDMSETEEEPVFSGDLHDYHTGEYIRPATAAELESSINGDRDTGAFLIDGRTVYVEGEQVSKKERP